MPRKRSSSKTTAEPKATPKRARTSTSTTNPRLPTDGVGVALSATRPQRRAKIEAQAKLAATTPNTSTVIAPTPTVHKESRKNQRRKVTFSIDETIVYEENELNMKPELPFELYDLIVVAPIKVDGITFNETFYTRHVMNVARLYCLVTYRKPKLNNLVPLSAKFVAAVVESDEIQSLKLAIQLLKMWVAEESDVIKIIKDDIAELETGQKSYMGSEETKKLFEQMRGLPTNEASEVLKGCSQEIHPLVARELKIMAGEE